MHSAIANEKLPTVATASLEVDRYTAAGKNLCERWCQQRHKASSEGVGMPGVLMGRRVGCCCMGRAARRRATAHQTRCPLGVDAADSCCHTPSSPSRHTTLTACAWRRHGR
jgi:hypothetical protein